MNKVDTIPILRFPQFKNAWTLSRLEELAIRGTGHTPDKKKPEYYSGDIKWISLADSNRLDQGYIIETTNTISLEGIKNSSAVIHPPETVLLSRDAGVGKSAVMGVEMAVSQHFVVWNGVTDRLDNWFLYYKLQILKPLFERMAVGNTIKTIGMPFFKSLKFQVPHINEQQKIASFLKSIDKRICLLDKKKKLLEIYKQGVMQKLFPKNGEKLPELRFKDEQEKDFTDWEVKKLGEICIKQSSNISANTLDKSYGSYKIYGAAGFLQFVDFYRQEEAYISIVKDGAGVGRTLLCEPKSSVLGTLDILKPTQHCDINFLFNILNRIVFEKYITGSTIPHIYYRDYSKEEIALPCINEQKKIAKFLNSLDSAIKKIEVQIEESKNFKKGLLQKMFV